MSCTNSTVRPPSTMERIETASTNCVVPLNLEAMFGHTAIERRTAKAEFRGSERDIAFMSRQSTFDDAPFHRLQMLRFLLAAWSG